MYRSTQLCAVFMTACCSLLTASVMLKRAREGGKGEKGADRMGWGAVGQSRVVGANA